MGLTQADRSTHPDHGSLQIPADRSEEFVIQVGFSTSAAVAPGRGAA